MSFDRDFLKFDISVILRRFIRRWVGMI